MATEANIQEFVCLKKDEREENALTSETFEEKVTELPGHQVKQLETISLVAETVNTPLEAGKPTDESGIFIQALSVTRVIADEHSNIPESYKAEKQTEPEGTTEIEEKAIESEVYGEDAPEKAEPEVGLKLLDSVEPSKKEAINMLEKNQGDSDGVTSSQDAACEDVKETTEEHAVIVADIKEHDLNETPREFVKEESYNIPVDAQEASEQCEIGSKDIEEQKDEESVKKIEQDEEIEEIKPYVEIEKREQNGLLQAITPDACISTQTIPQVETTEHEEKEKDINVLEKDQDKDGITSAQELAFEGGLQEKNHHNEDNVQEVVTAAKGTEEVDADVCVSTLTTLVKESIKNEEPDDEKAIEKEVCVENGPEKAELEGELQISDGMAPSQKETLSTIEKDKGGSDGVTSSQESPCVDVEETTTVQHVTTAIDSKEQDLNEKPREFIKEETEDKSLDAQEASEECKKEEIDQNLEESVKKIEEETVEIKPGVETDETKEQNELLPAITTDVCITAQTKSQVEKTEHEEEDTQNDDGLKEKSDGPSIKEVCEETVSEKHGYEKEVKQSAIETVTKDENEDEEKKQEVKVVETNEGKDDVTSAQDVAIEKDLQEKNHLNEDVEREVVTAEESKEKDIEVIRSTEKTEQQMLINANPSDVCISAQTEPEEETIEKNDEEAVEKDNGQSTNKSEGLLLSDSSSTALNENETVRKDEDQEKEQEIYVSEKVQRGGDDVTGSENASNEHEQHTEEIKPSIETAEEKDVCIPTQFESQENAIENDDDQKEKSDNPFVNEVCEENDLKKTESEEEIKLADSSNVTTRETVVEATQETKSSDETKENTEQQGVLNVVTTDVCSPPQTEYIEKTTASEEKNDEETVDKDDDQTDKPESPFEVACEATNSEIAESEIKHSESSGTTLNENEPLGKEENLEKEDDIKTLEVQGGEDDVTSSQNASNEDIKETSTGQHDTSVAYVEEGQGVIALPKEILIEEAKEKSIDAEELAQPNEQSVEDTYDDTTKEEKCTPEQEPVKEHRDRDEVLKEKETDLIETKVVDPKEEIVPSTSLETSTEDTSNSDKETTESRNLPTEDLITASEEQIPEPVSKSEESMLKEPCLISETETQVDEKETVTKEISSAEKTEVQSVGDDVTSSQNASTEDIQETMIGQHDTTVTFVEEGQGLSATPKEILIEEAEDKSVVAEEMPLELGQSNEQNVEEDHSCISKTITENPDHEIKKEDKDLSHESVEETNDDIVKEEKCTLEQEPIEEHSGLDEVSKEKVTDLNETTEVEPKEDITPSTSLETSTEDTSNSEKERAESEKLPIEDLETVSEVQIPESVPKSEKPMLKEKCFILETETQLDEEKGIVTEDILSNEKTQQTTAIKQQTVKEVCEKTSSEKVELEEGLQLSDSSNMKITEREITFKDDDEEKDQEVNMSTESQDEDNLTSSQIEVSEENEELKEKNDRNEGNECDLNKSGEDVDEDTEEIKSSVDTKENTEHVTATNVCSATQIETREETIKNEVEETVSREINLEKKQEDVEETKMGEHATTNEEKDVCISTQNESQEEPTKKEDNDIEYDGDRKEKSDNAVVKEVCEESDLTTRESSGRQLSDSFDVKTREGVDEDTEETKSSDETKENMEQQGVLNVITSDVCSSMQTEIIEKTTASEETNDVETIPNNDGQTEKPESPLVEVVCETTRSQIVESEEEVKQSDSFSTTLNENEALTNEEKLEKEDIKTSEVEGGTIEVTSSQNASIEDIKETTIDQHDTTVVHVEETQDVSASPKEILIEEAKEKSIDANEMLLELGQPIEQNPEDEIKNRDLSHESVEDTNDNAAKEEKCTLEHEPVEEHSAQDEVSKENVTDLNETTVEPQKDITPSISLETPTEDASNSEKEKAEIENLPIEDFETVSEVQVPELVPKSEESVLKEECFISEPDTHVDEEIRTITEEISSDEKTEQTAEIKQETVKEACEDLKEKNFHNEGNEGDFIESREVVDEDTREIKSSVETEDTEKVITTISSTQIEPDDETIEKEEKNNEKALKSDENEIVSREENLEKKQEDIKETDTGEHATTVAYFEEGQSLGTMTKEVLGEAEEEDKSVTAQEKTEQCDGESIKKEQKPEEQTDEIKPSVETNEEKDVCIPTPIESHEEPTKKEESAIEHDGDLKENSDNPFVKEVCEESDLTKIESEEKHLSDSSDVKSRECVNEDTKETKFSDETKENVEQQGVLKVVTTDVSSSTDTENIEKTTASEENNDDETIEQDDGQTEKPESPLVEVACEETRLEIAESDEVVKHSDSSSTTLTEHEAQSKEEKLETEDKIHTSEVQGDGDEVTSSQNASNDDIKETPIDQNSTTVAHVEGQGVSALPKEILTEEAEDKSIDTEEVSLEHGEPNEQNVMETLPCPNESISDNLEDEVKKEDKDLSHKSVEDTTDDVKEERCTLEHEPVEKVTDLNETTAVEPQEDITPSISLDTSAENTSNSEKEKAEVETLPIEDLGTVSEVKILELVPKSEESVLKEECFISETETHLDEEKGTITEEISSDEKTEQTTKIKQETVKEVCEETSSEKAEFEEGLKLYDASNMMINEKAITFKDKDDDQEVNASAESQVEDNITSSQDEVSEEKEDLKEKNYQNDGNEGDFIKTESGEGVDEDTEEIKSSVETKDNTEHVITTNVCSSAQTEPKEETIENKETNEEEHATTTAHFEELGDPAITKEITEEEVEDKSVHAQEASEQCENEAPGESVNKPVNSCSETIEGSIKEEEEADAENKKEIESELEAENQADRTEDRTETKDEAVLTEKVSKELEQKVEETEACLTETISEKTEDEITKDEDLCHESIEHISENVTKEEKCFPDVIEISKLEHKPVEAPNDSQNEVSKENFTDITETVEVEPQEDTTPSSSLGTSAEDTSNSDKAKAVSENLPLEDLDSVSEVHIPEVLPKSEDSKTKEECLVSATETYADEENKIVTKDISSDEKLETHGSTQQPENSYSTTEENITQLEQTGEINSPHENRDLKEDVTQENQLDSTEDCSIMEKNVILTEEIEQVPLETEKEKGTNDFKEQIVEEDAYSPELVEKSAQSQKEIVHEISNSDSVPAEKPEVTEANVDGQIGQEDIQSKEDISCVLEVTNDATVEPVDLSNIESTAYPSESEKLATRALEFDSDVQIPEVVAASEDSDVKKECIALATTEYNVEEQDTKTDEISSAPDKEQEHVTKAPTESDEAKSRDLIIDKALAKENLEIQELEPMAEPVIEEDQVTTETKPQPEQSDITSENITNDQTLESKLEHTSVKDLEDGKEHMEEDVTLAPENETTKNIILTDEVAVVTEKENDRTGIEKQVSGEDNCPTELESTPTPDQKELANEIEYSKPIPVENPEVTEVKAESPTEVENIQAAEDPSCLSKASSVTETPKVEMHEDTEQTITVVGEVKDDGIDEASKDEIVPVLEDSKASELQVNLPEIESADTPSSDQDSMKLKEVSCRTQENIEEQGALTSQLTGREILEDKDDKPISELQTFPDNQKSNIKRCIEEEAEAQGNFGVEIKDAQSGHEAVEDVIKNEVLPEDEKAKESESIEDIINEEAKLNQLTSNKDVFQIESSSSRPVELLETKDSIEDIEDAKFMADNLSVKDETITAIKGSNEDSEIVASELKRLENTVTDKEKESLDEPEADESEKTTSTEQDIDVRSEESRGHGDMLKLKEDSTEDFGIANEGAKIVPECTEASAILTDNLPEASPMMLLAKPEDKIPEDRDVLLPSVGKDVIDVQKHEKNFDYGTEVRIADVLSNVECSKTEPQHLDTKEATSELINEENQREQTKETDESIKDVIPVEDVKTSTRELEVGSVALKVPSVIDATADKANNKTVEVHEAEGLLKDNKHLEPTCDQSKPIEEGSGIKQEPLELGASGTLGTAATEDLMISKKYVADDLIKVGQTNTEIPKYKVPAYTVDKQSPKESTESKILTEKIDSSHEQGEPVTKPSIPEAANLKADTTVSVDQKEKSESVEQAKIVLQEPAKGNSEVTENIITEKDSALKKDQQVEKEETEVKTDVEEEEDNEDDENMGSCSDAPVMVEASKDMEVKAHKKSHNILSGVGSKVKHSIAKVKKAITGKSSPTKSTSPKAKNQVTG